MKRVWKAHLIVLGVLVLLVAGLSLLVWLHPTLGFASHDSIIAGADLRSTIIQLLWICFACGAVTATLTIAIMGCFSQRRTILLSVAYVCAFGIQPGLLHILDHYY